MNPEEAHRCWAGLDQRSRGLPEPHWLSAINEPFVQRRARGDSAGRIVTDIEFARFDGEPTSRKLYGSIAEFAKSLRTSSAVSILAPSLRQEGEEERQ